MREHTPYPPKLALRLFRWYCRKDRVEELEGDLLEFFYDRIDAGEPVWKAKAFFWWNTIRCYRTYARTKTQKTMTYYPLFKSYFKLAIRQSWKNKWTVLINVLGLGLALSMCVFLYTMHAFNIEFDNYYEDTENIYRLHSMTFENGAERRNEISPTGIDYALRNKIPGVQSVASYYDTQVNVKHRSNYFEEMVAFVSDDFFDMFPHELWYGSLKNFEEQPVAFLTQQTAKKYFGKEVALEEKLTIYLRGDKKIDVIVAGVFKRIPENSSFDGQIFVNYRHYKNALGIELNDWKKRRYVAHYIKAQPSALSNIKNQLQDYLPTQNRTHEEMPIQAFDLMPFNSPLYSFDNLHRNYTNARTRPSVIILFTTIISMIFLIACFNLANTSMAMIAKRLKEIGIRKTLGSNSKLILVQFLIEMGIIAALAFVIAVSTSNMTSRIILGMFGGNFLLQDVSLVGIVAFIFVFLLITTLLAGILPALYAYRFQPVEIMRKTVRLRGINWLNKSLVVVQFAFAISVLAVGIVFSQNKVFLQNLDVGYRLHDVYVFDTKENKHFELLASELAKIPGLKIAGTRNHIGRFGSASLQSFYLDTTKHQVKRYSVGENYLELMGVKPILGRYFLAGKESDNQSLIVNQKFAAQYFEGDALNQILKIDNERYTIVGVVDDPIDDVYQDGEQPPFIIKKAPREEMSYLVINASADRLAELESKFRQIWSQQIDLPYTGQLQQEMSLGTAVNDSSNLQKIFIAMAILGGFLSLIGVFSLAKLNVAKKLKEMSIRKVLGATLSDLFVGVNKAFFAVLLLSLIVGSALGFFISKSIMSMIYRYHVQVSLFTSLACATFLVLFSLIIISIAVYQPTKANPVVGLRDE